MDSLYYNISGIRELFNKMCSAILSLTKYTFPLFKIISSLAIFKLNFLTLDHLQSTILKPYFKLSCPDVTKWSRNHINKNYDLSCTVLPQIIMITARPLERRLNAFRSWSKQDLNLVNTTFLGNSSLQCSTITWSNKLFAIYLEVFSHVLWTYSNHTDFIFVEDDVHLLDADQMHVETCMARFYKYEFYSFFRTESQGDSCMYQYGTEAFYVTRKFIETILADIDTKTRCRIAIDMYIAAHGPWYATRNYLVRHNSSRFYSNVKDFY